MKLNVMCIFEDCNRYKIKNISFKTKNGLYFHLFIFNEKGYYGIKHHVLQNGETSVKCTLS